MSLPTTRHATYVNGVWTIGEEVPRPWPRWIANAVAILAVMGLIAIGTWEIVVALGCASRL